MRRIARERWAVTHGDEGISLVELLVALVVASIVLTGVAYGVTQALWTSRDSKDREVAANLAAEAIDQARATTDYINLTGSSTTQTINGEVFTVLRTVTSYSSLGAASPCDGAAGTFIKYKKISIRVTWPRMKTGTAAVRADTLLAPGASSFDPLMGNIGAKVLDATGGPVEGISVTITSGASSRTQFTDEMGCAFFDGLVPGSYTATVSTAGYVSSNGSFTPSQPATVTQGTTTPLAFDYDKIGSLAANIGSTQYPAPATVPLAIGNTALLPDGTVSYAGTGPSRTLTNRFPFASGYSLWAGSCQDADPAGNSGSGPYYPTASRGTAVQAVTTGTPAPVDLVMAHLRVVVISNATGLPVPGASVRAAHSGTAPCDFPESYTVGTTDSNGELKASMPWGTWDFTVSGLSLVAPVTPQFAPTTSEIYVEVRVP